LELDEDVEIEPVRAGLDPPHHIVAALAQVVGDIAGRDLLQGAVVQPVQPGVGDRGLAAVGVDGIKIRRTALTRIEGKSLYC
jgi:hypothetical protein